MSDDNGKNSHLLIRTYFEGDDDRVVLEWLREQNLLPVVLEIAQRNKQFAGRDGMMQELSSFVDPVRGVGGASAIALVDLDDVSLDDVAPWAERCLRSRMRDVEVQRVNPGSVRVAAFQISDGGRSGHVAVVPVGLTIQDALMREYNIERFAMDDYIFRLISNKKIYEAMEELRDVSRSMMRKKLGEMRALFTTNNMPLVRSKRLLHLIRAIVGFRASSATFVEQTLKSASYLGISERRNSFLPLLKDIETAIGFLSRTR